MALKRAVTMKTMSQNLVVTPLPSSRSGRSLRGPRIRSAPRSSMSSPRWSGASRRSRAPRISECEVDGHRQSPSPPVREAVRRALVLLDEEVASQLVLCRVLDHARPSLEALARDPDLHLGGAPEVLSPVGSPASAREHVEDMAVESEPHLNCMWPPRNPPDGREIAEILTHEISEVTSHQSSPQSPRTTKN